MLQNYVSAAFAVLAVCTVEEDRFQHAVLADFPEKQVWCVSASGGLRDVRSGTVIDAGASFGRAFAAAAEKPDTLLLVFDWQHVCRNAVAYRALKDCFTSLKAHGSCILLVAPSWSLPPELFNDVPLISWNLPSRTELKAALNVVAESVNETVTSEIETACLDAAAGLTLQEAENSFALSLVECGELNPARVEAEKMRLVKSSGFLEVWPAVPPDSVGGLGQLKDYFANEVLPCRDDAAISVRGLLLVGIPGSGKSLSAKAAGAMLQYPVLKLDIGNLKGSLVGQSEAQMRSALRLAEAVAPCVLWLDELEKGVGGYQSSAQTDSGVTLGMVGQLLTWLQEHTAPVLTIATCNDHKALPAELTRAGRFDEQFFVDVPSLSERVEIARIHLARLSAGQNGESAEALAAHIAELAQGWTGAEIQQLVKSAARRSARRPTAELLTTCAADIKPILQTRKQEFAEMREWAKSSMRIANTPDEEEKPAHGRRLAVAGRGNNPASRGPSKDGTTGISLN